MADRRPMLVINFKAYPSSHGEKASQIARLVREFSEETLVKIILVPPHTEVYRLSRIYPLVYGQPPDKPSTGSYTGHTTVEMLVSAGARGLVLNHSEKKMIYTHLHEIHEKAKSYNLETIICAETPIEAKAVALLEPDYVAIEPPELIGTGIPVSKARPEVITQSIKAVKTVSPGTGVIAGAGITTGEDASKAVELGAKGVLVASAVMKADDPISKIRELASALEKAWEAR